MSELDLNNIVGFKAIDADGNEQQVTVDEMVGLVSARIVSAASEISTFEAAAEAGTDEFEDQLTVSDTFSWLRTMDGSKNPTLTSSTAAAKVLGELFSSLQLYPFMFKRVLNDSDSLDNLRETGIYFSDNEVERGVIIVFTHGYGSLQIVSGNGGNIKMRAYWSVWFDWVRIS